MNRVKVFLKRSSLSSAFTLVEMLLVVSLLSLVSIAIYHAIADGVKIWEHSRKFVIDEDVAVFFEKLDQDIQNQYSYSAIEFEGKPERMTIPSLVRVPVDKMLSKKSLDLIEQLGTVEYYLRRDKNVLIRRQGNYSQSLKHQFGPGRVIAQNILNLKFSYITIQDGVVKTQHALKEQVPISVQVDLDVKTATGQIRKFTRIINFPLGAPS